MKKPNNIEKEIDAIRKQLQKEREGMSSKEAIDKINKEARDLAKIYGLKFAGDTSEYPVSENNFSMIAEESEEYNSKKKSE